MIWHYRQKNFPPEAQTLLVEAGFQCKHNLWYRIYGESLLQMVAISRTPFPFVLFSSDPTFCPVFDPDAVPYDGMEFPSRMVYNANYIYGGIHSIQHFDPLLRCEYKNENEKEQVISFLVSIVRDIVIPSLNRCATVLQDLDVWHELGFNLTKFYRPDMKPDSFDIIYSPAFRDKMIYELCYSGDLNQCIDYIKRERVKEIENVNRCREGYGEELTAQLIEHMISCHQDLLELAEKADYIQLDRIFQMNHRKFATGIAEKLKISKESFKYRCPFKDLK